MEGSRIIVAVLVGCLAFFALIAVFVGEGFVRQVPIFWNEEVHATVAFRTAGPTCKWLALSGTEGLIRLLS